MTFDAIVIGIGHAGIEAALASAKKGHKTLALSISLDNAGFLACNPSIGGTAKGHIVCEIDALGGEMGRAADKTLTHLRMLNASKGVAVQCLRAQVDKYKYHDYMKEVLENTENLTLRQAEVKELIVKHKKIAGVTCTNGLVFFASTVIVATGVYLESCIITGSVIEEKGPSGFSRANYLANSLRELGFNLRRFKTGTPARIKRDSVNFNLLELQHGENTPYSFSLDNATPQKQARLKKQKTHCYLGYTNEGTHSLIENNLSQSPKYAGLISGAGARYCPSVEDKIVRFKDKQRHPFFLESEGDKTQEMYVQGMSTGLPASVQENLYRSIKGLENVEIMRDAYAIEYECINPMELYPTLESKAVSGLYFAGQINGTSGYEEAAAQGLIAGLNAALKLEKKPPVILPRASSYIGVLIDDLVTKGTDEPYRMMTSRAEFRLLLRGDNADLRLSEIGYKAGLLHKKNFNLLKSKCRDIEIGKERLGLRPPQNKVQEFLAAIGEPAAFSGLSIEDIIKRGNTTFENFSKAFDVFDDLQKAAAYDVFVGVKYRGYIAREKQAAEDALALSKMALEPNVDYNSIHGLRLEAREKLSKIKPLTIAQAASISGITPADINVLILTLKK